MRRTTMETLSGKWIDFKRIDPRVIDLKDIAHSLSLVCRFGGHIPRFYSVAEHALLVRELTVDYLSRPDLGLAALHHDSHEAYLGDVPTPLKDAAGAGFVRLAKALDEAIKVAFGIDADFCDPVIKRADELALRMEAWQMKPSGGIQGARHFVEPPPVNWTLPLVSPRTAEQQFMTAHSKHVGPVYA